MITETGLTGALGVGMAIFTKNNINKRRARL